MVERPPWGNALVAVETGHLREAEVYDAEVKAIHAAVKRAARRRPSPTRIYSDNQTAVDSRKYNAAPSSQAEALEGIRGNGEADLLAKRAAAAPGKRSTEYTPTVARVKALAKEKRHKAIQQWWEDNAPASYRRLELGPYPDTVGLTRPQIAALVAYRTGHGNFASYYRRFNINREDPRCARRIKDRHKIATEEALYKFVVGKGAKEWFCILAA
ncbi:hypothetical protein B0H63DRAFT_449288 [Podospora didyma]|uniref:RNase H type-1 domain-containing protein n=1 Tax=Podospora didyma TaxID=330526 RepID=A0AAE0NPK9_9PEZI|nr:hypothetical protein B0H63DRAFT_449288 [Podospora didyma]